MDERKAFLRMSSERKLDFSTLRRAKYSTMSLLYMLHNLGNDRFVCNICRTHVEARYHCATCHDFYLCATCYEKDGHRHDMEEISICFDDGSSPADQREAKPRVQEEAARQQVPGYGIVNPPTGDFMPIIPSPQMQKPIDWQMVHESTGTILPSLDQCTQRSRSSPIMSNDVGHNRCHLVYLTLNLLEIPFNIKVKTIDGPGDFVSLKISMQQRRVGCRYIIEVQKDSIGNAVVDITELPMQKVIPEYGTSAGMDYNSYDIGSGYQTYSWVREFAHDIHLRQIVVVAEPLTAPASSAVGGPPLTHN